MCTRKVSDMSTVISQLTTQRNAIAMLNSRIQFLHQYLQDIKAGLIPADHDILRQISSFCKRHTVLQKKAFEDQFSTVNISFSCRVYNILTLY